MKISLWKSIQIILAAHLIGVFFFTTYFFTTFMQNFIQDSNDFIAKVQQRSFIKKSQLDYYIFTQEIKKYDGFGNILGNVLEGNLSYQIINDQDLIKNYDINFYEYRNDSECIDWISKHIFLIDYFYKGMKSISNIYIIYNSTCALTLSSNYSQKFSLNLRESAIKAHAKGRYLSKTSTSEGLNINLLCKDWDFAVICSEIYTSYTNSMFVIDGFEVLWHSNIQDNLVDCEFGNESYPLITSEKKLFRENIIENKEKVRVETWFIKKGEKMYEIFRNAYMDKYDRWNFWFIDNYFQFSLSSLEKTFPTLLAELIIISIILAAYIYDKILVKSI
ncbi:hypothetical protein SteCoe_33856 [Stentor coeruleus]|uniref:Uncharacterized protein n=1 Tax=Stentor coeruleus TaxID=5963 RepID=A0A1R2AW03_9CILI|nr:hypothetical protein SteCoe_33856 [Stentor coeruleus]